MKRQTMHTHANTQRACGLDFGTSNSTLGTAQGGNLRLIALEEGHVTVPSAVFFGQDLETQFLIGRAAVKAYTDGMPGRLMRSLKSILGSSLIDERTQVYRKRLAFSQVIEHYVASLKRRAEQSLSFDLDCVVHGRPVHFVDNDADADRYAEDSLRQIAHNIGFKHVSFQFEPIAAASDFERQVERDHIALIADIGGGTSDFTVVRLGPSARARADRASDILATGGMRLGGTDYDRYLSMNVFMPLLGYRSRQKRGDINVPSGPFVDLSTWASVHHVYDPKRLTEIKAIRHSAAEPDLLNRLLHVIEHRKAHSILIAAEAAKIALSDHSAHETDFAWIEKNLSAVAQREAFEVFTQSLFDRLKTASADCVKHAGLTHDKITAVFFTGGTSSIPSVRRAILSNFEGALVVDGDKFGSVGLGLSIEAARRYG
jgi:hypothetical chaperone protein